MPLLPPHLTPREQEVLRLVLRGLANKQIAGLLGISVTTVNLHLRNLQKKLGVRSRGELWNAYAWHVVHHRQRQVIALQAGIERVTAMLRENARLLDRMSNLLLHKDAGSEASSATENREENEQRGIQTEGPSEAAAERTDFHGGGLLGDPPPGSGTVAGERPAYHESEPE